MENDSREGGKIICPDCGTGLSLQEPPEWFDRVFSGAFLIAGAREPSDESNIETGELEGPVVFTCSKCGAAIKLDGNERNVTCEHCDEPVHIPDDLWLRFHPSPKKIRWFVGYRWEINPYDDEE
jgi:DNA-directed RNA polymerase subunit RPC12/RpoP